MRLVLMLAKQIGQAEDTKIGTTGPLMLVGSGLGHCPRDGLAVPLRMFYHTTVRLHRNKFYLIYIVKIEWLVADLTAVGSLDRAERGILEGIVPGCILCQIRSYLWLGSHFVV